MLGIYFTRNVTVMKDLKYPLYISECGALADPENGEVSVTQTIYNEIASYKCNPGYDLIGVSQRVCKEDKTWSHSAPVCVIKGVSFTFSLLKVHYQTLINVHVIGITNDDDKVLIIFYDIKGLLQIWRRSIQLPKRS